MNIDDLCKEDSSIREYIERFVDNPLFLIVKDAFVANVPSGGSEAEETCVRVNQGKYLGTRHVFNKMQDISRQTKTEKAIKKEASKVPSGGKDADLDD